MAWIREIDEHAATGELRRIYEQIKERRGKVAKIMKVHSLSPQAMQRHSDLYLTLMFELSGLMREEREALAVAVSAANKCEYCVAHHAEALDHYWKDREKVDALAGDWHSLELPNRLEKMLEYALKLTRTPGEMGEADVRALREAGLSDEEILNVDLVTSYFNFVNRIASGLGVKPTPDETTGYKY